MLHPVDRTFDVLLTTRGRCARQVLLSALDESDAHIQARAVSALVLLHPQEGLPAVIEAFDRLPWQGRAEVAEAWERLLPAIRSALRTGKVAHRENAVAILATVGRAHLAGILAGALTDGSPQVRAGAAGALRQMARRWRVVVTECGQGKSGAGHVTWSAQNARRELLGALKTAVQTYEIHGESKVLESFLFLGEEAQNELIALVEAGSARLANGFVETLTRGHRCLTAGFLLRCMLSPSLKVKAAAQRVFSERQEPEFAADIENDLNERERAGRLSVTEGDDGWWEIAVQRLKDLHEAFQVKMVKLVLDQLHGEARIHRLASLVASDFSTVRTEIILAAREEPSDPARQLVVSMLHDPDEKVQLLATQEVVGYELDHKMELLLGQLHSRYGSVRNLAGSEVARVGFQRYMASFDRLDDAARRRTGAALSRIDGGLLKRLVEPLGALEPQRRIQALRIVRTIEKATDLQAEILRLVNDPDQKVRATAVIALGAIGSAPALQALLAALHDPDLRVRANAIEALEQVQRPEFAELLVPFVASPDNRIRANALKALWHLGHPEAAKQVAAMVADADPTMRRSAVWALGQTDMPGAAATLRRLADSDPDDAIRSAAREALEEHE